MCLSGRSVALENCQIACRVTAVCLYPRTADVQGSGERAGLGVALSFFFLFYFSFLISAAVNSCWKTALSEGLSH